MKSRHCHVNWHRTQMFLSFISSRIHACTFPPAACFSAKALEPASIVEMTLNGEGIGDGGVNIEKSLGGCGGLKSLHFLFTLSHRLMRVLRAIV